MSFVEFKEGKKWSGKVADISDKLLEGFQDAGYVLTENDLVVDVDDLNHIQIQQLIKRFNIHTEIVWTERGCHFRFKKPEGFRAAKSVTALGVEVEYKHLKNTKATCVKKNGIVRQVDNEGVREDLPNFLSPKRKCKSMVGMENGDGRNPYLYQHRLDIHTMKNWKQILIYINQIVFAEALPDDEFETICREMTISAEKNGEAMIADLIMRDKKIVSYKGFLYFYDGVKYVCDPEQLVRMVYDHCEGMPTKYVDEVMKQMRYRAIVIDKEKEFDIKFKNGILRNGQFIEVDYLEFTPYYIDIDYLKDAIPVPEVDEYIEHLGMSEDLKTSEAEYRALIIEALSSCLITDKGFKKALARFFFFVGNGGNGKGTFLEIATAILGADNTTALSPVDMCKESYLVGMVGKLANFGDDVPDTPINNEQMKILKNISTCDRIELRHLYAESTSARITSTMIFTCNGVLKSFEKGEAFKRRVLWMPMYYKPAFNDPNFIKRLTTIESREYWIRLIVEGYMRLYAKGGYTESKIVNDCTAEYHEDNDPTNEWLDLKKTENFVGKKFDTMYNEFRVWYEDDLNKGERLKPSQYRKILKANVLERFNLDDGRQTINGSQMRCYVLRTD
jgi:putative DNA primase/helicase